MKIDLMLLLAVTCAARVFAAVDPGQLAAARALHEERDKSAEARQAFEKISAADPACAETHSFLAQLALRRNDAGQAVQHAEKAVALAPDNADALKKLR